jgi:purine-nucleoside phosphorylase
LAELPPFARFKELAQEHKPILALALGSGLGPIAVGLEALLSVPYSQIPGLSAPSVPGHRGCLTLANWAGGPVLLLDGRLHLYEGHDRETITQPIRMAQALGARILLSTNAAGGIHPQLTPGSFMLIRHHLNWTQTKPWTNTNVSQNSSGFDLRSFPEIASQYSVRLLKMLVETASELQIGLIPGTYAGVTGPNYETPAEICALRFCGADAVGMSTIHEIQAAHDLGMECAAISCITNRGAGLDPEAVITHDEVLETAHAASHNLARLIAACIEKIA